ncbi:uncharacterized protein LOC127795821 [Diospyros lotus]|uniref:uncharacterized protein LOC127795821 n=1 Tax=Diospyros lotus TaxID=55363 RepID=UPI00225714C2|nr:uncharacterized protein LOC127795821 [Diospyros lotus]
MAVSSAFRERLEQIEQTRNQRLSLLQAERELQIAKSQLLSTMLSNIRSREQSCLILDRRIASQQFTILSLRSEIATLDSKHDINLQQIRVLKNEVEELEQMEKEKEWFYDSKRRQIEEFHGQVENFVVDYQIQVQKLRNKVSELKSSFMEIPRNSGYVNNSEIAAAEMKKSELLAAKENLDTNLASNYQMRAQLQKQLHSILLVEAKRDGN